MRGYIASFGLIIWLLAGFLVLVGVYDQNHQKTSEIITFRHLTAYRIVDNGSIYQKLDQMASKAGISPGLLRFIYNCETWNGQDVFNENDPRGGAEGYMQIILQDHPTVSKACAYNLECYVNYFIKRFKQGDGSRWECYNIYQRRLIN